MALLIWFTMGVALWHFTVFLPDRFLGGIVGALVGSVIGSVGVGWMVHALQGKPLSEADIGTLLTALPGVALGLLVVYLLGVRQAERAQ